MGDVTKALKIGALELLVFNRSCVIMHEVTVKLRVPVQYNFGGIKLCQEKYERGHVRHQERIRFIFITSPVQNLSESDMFHSHQSPLQRRKK